MASGLHEAARNGNVEEVDRILSIPDGMAPDPEDKDNLGRTAMHLAAWAGHAAVIKRIVQAKGDPLATAMDGVTSLHFACQKGAIEAISELLAANADVRAKDRKKKNTPLHVACEKGHIEAIKLLVEAGADLKERNKAGKTAFEACKNDETKMALPGGYSKVKGERSSWKERDPKGFEEAQKELEEKKETKRERDGNPNDVKDGNDADSKKRAADDVEEDPQDEEETPFAVPTSKKKSKTATKANPPEVQAEPSASEASTGAAEEAAGAASIGPSIGPAMPPAGAVLQPSQEEDSNPPEQPPAAAAAAAAPPAGGAGQLSGLLASRAELEDMLLDDPDNEELLAMQTQLETAIAAMQARR